MPGIPLQVNAAIEDTGNPTRDCQLFLNTVTEELGREFHPTKPIWPLLAARADAVDQLIRHLWSRAGLEDLGLGIFAVGGYGRGELYPQSDIDLLVLTEGDTDTDTGERLTGLLQQLWDIGLTVGSSVRSIDECAELAANDLTIFTTLIEARPIVGDTDLLPILNDKVRPASMWDSKSFYLAKLAETNERHDKFANTENNLEPHVKNGPGGLRDIQVIGWIATRHYGISLEALDEVDYLNPDEKRMLEAGKNFIGQVRFALHMLTGREEDRLLFDHQRKLAAQWEMVDGEKLAVEQFMQVYYRWAQAIGQLYELVMQAFDQQILHAEDTHPQVPIDDDFEVMGGLLSARHANVFQDKPGNILRAFVILANDASIGGITPSTWRLLRAAQKLITPAFRSDPENQKYFMALLQSPHGVTMQLRRMARHGILGKYLPEFGRIVGQMQFDLFHAYTVDAHTLEVLANTRRFMRADFTDKFPVSTRIAQRLRKPVLLYIAALYHDIGKGRGGDHSELGAVDAHGFCQRHGLDQRDTELVVWLVKNHLFMSSFSQRKDISDPDEILKFASHVTTEERLDYLYTLTVADIHGTNPELWNAWRSSLLRQTYTETRRALRRGLENPLARQDVVDATRAAAADLLEYRGFLSSDMESVWASRDDDYFVRERPEDIAWHTEAIANHRDPGNPLVLVQQSQDSAVANATQIFVHGPDRPELFARLCAEIEFLDLSINDARIYTGMNGTTLDTFFVLKADGSPVPDDAVTLEKIRSSLQRAMDSSQDRSFTHRLPRRKKSFVIPTETSLYQDTNRGWSVLEVTTRDRPGLLAHIGSIFVSQGIGLQAAKIQTLGERVEDVFFITDRQGNMIQTQNTLDLLTDTIRETLDEGTQAPS